MEFCMTNLRLYNKKQNIYLKKFLKRKNNTKFTLSNRRDIINKGGESMDLSNFKPYIVSPGVSSLTIGKNGLAFSKTAVIRLDKPEFVVLLIDVKDHVLAVQPTEKENENATPFFKKGRKNIFVRWNYQDLIEQISELMSWNFKNTTYKVKGEYSSEDNLLVFKLDEATPI